MSFQKSIPFEVKINRGKREFEGYASTWDRDLVGDIIEQGAFTKTIQEKLPTKGIKVLYNHFDLIGHPLRMQEDSKGLYVVAYVSETTLGNDVLTMMEDGTLNQMSIGYDIVKDALSEDGRTRYLKELQLYEFSPVAFPANPATSIVQVRKNVNSLLSEIQTEHMQMALKEGRVLSQKNITALQQARDAIDEVIRIATEKSRAGNSHSIPEEQVKSFSDFLQEMNQQISEMNR